MNKLAGDVISLSEIVAEGINGESECLAKGKVSLRFFLFFASFSLSLNWCSSDVNLNIGKAQGCFGFYEKGKTTWVKFMSLLISSSNVWFPNVKSVGALGDSTEIAMKQRWWTISWKEM